MMQYIRLIFYGCVMALLCVSSPPLHAQQNQRLEGKVTNRDSIGLEGVSVVVKGTSNSTSTDADGNFLLKAPERGSVVVVSSVGFRSQEISYVGQETLNIVLEGDNTALSEVVVVGYGTQRRRDLTGAVGSVDVDDLNKAPVRSFDEALAGRVAGVQVNSQDGQPGSPIEIIIRGANSLTQENSPLYVIDGFPIENPDNNMLNPMDIESIDILKDASATAIYGARAANGVIMITTKRGQVGLPKISYLANYAISQITKRMDMLNAYDFVELQYEINPYRTDTTYLKDLSLDYYRNMESLNFQDIIFKDRPMHNHTLSLRGGNENTKYSLSGNLLLQDGIIIKTGYDRYQGNFALDQRINDRLSMGFNVSYASLMQIGNSPSTDGVTRATYLLYSVLGYRPVGFEGEEQNIMEELLDPEITDERTNPYVTLQNEVRRNGKENLMANGFLSYKISPYLQLRVTGGTVRSSQLRESFNNSKTRSGAQINGPNGAFVSAGRSSWVNENILTYTRTFGANQLTAMSGSTLSGQKMYDYGASAFAVPNESLELSGLDEGTPRAITSSSSMSTLTSFFGRINYGYNDKYLVTVTLRADGSSKFSRTNRWGYFPSFAVAWKAKEERWLQSVALLSDLKFRFSYGLIGNNRVSDFAYYSALGFPFVAAYSFDNVTPSKGVYISSLSNVDLKWESTASFDIGMDASFFSNRLNVVVDLYQKNTTDLLLNADLPPTTGFDRAYKNVGEVKNQGLEISVNTVNIRKPFFEWRTGFNISFNRNEVKSFTQNQTFMLTNITWDQNYNNTPLYKSIIGQPISQFYGLMFDGLYQEADFDQVSNPDGTVAYTLRDGIPSNGNARASIMPGDARYVDVDGDLTITENDYAIIGNPNPKFAGGLSNQFSYKGIDLSVFLQYSYGNDVYNANRLIFETPSSFRPGLNYFDVVKDRWTPENPESTIHRLDGYGIINYSDRFVEDGSYLRLKTVSIGYTIPESKLKHIGVKSLRVSLSGQNLYTFTTYSGFDPEVSVRNSALTLGFDYSSYPRPRIFSFGVDITL